MSNTELESRYQSSTQQRGSISQETAGEMNVRRVLLPMSHPEQNFSSALKKMKKNLNIIFEWLNPALHVCSYG